MDQYEAQMEAYYAKEAFEEAQEETWREAAEASGEGGRALREALEEVRKKRESLAKVQEESFRKFEETGDLPDDEARKEERRAHQALEEARQKLVQMVKQGAQESTTKSQTRAFVSYVRENIDLVDKLCADLKMRGVQIWKDRDHIPPGQRWQAAIRTAIKEGSCFLACFSKEYSEKSHSYMNEELTLAIDELRKKPTDRVWFIPILLTHCMLPDRQIGGGETLRDLQWVPLYENWDHGVDLIVQSVAEVTSLQAEGNSQC